MIASDDELDAKLRLLFADDRLGGLQPKADASETIVAGARRRRNRRKAITAAGGAAVAAVLVVGGVTFAKVQERDTQAALSPGDTQTLATGGAPPTGEVGGTVSPASPGQTSSSTSAAATSSNSPKTTPSSGSANPDGPAKVLTGQVLGHSGIGNLALGMTEAQLTATGITFKKESGSSPCVFGTVANVSGQSGDIRVYLSDTSGVTQILPMLSHTPEGVGTGSTVEDVTKIYTNATTAPKLSVNLGSTSYEFALSSGKVKGLVLKTNNGQGCGA
ncbi:hypothetical protein SAMN05421504_1021195 [Amycolatopsis xylanica]|uniref:Uncharacterized protein n=1 Tax=Amycolatopsis xylanica TaxID=589385 RepID=A0A1H3B6X7_9PSEU|nr:hypothetical protein [Amycolatopsis xylanica]SDX37391.1 hypothetical protein SAMN05421504_1021195 [Amycolatopsis xylanica]